MSMLSEQAKRLRKTADKMRNAARIVDWYPYSANLMRDAARDMRDAADTIDELRSRCQEMQEMERQTCLMETTNASDYDWRCNECGEHVSMCSGKPRFCPSCGRKVVS